jgi:L-ascorbate metabolism protein UlaG (beta-lactamase superfamily)
MRLLFTFTATIALVGATVFAQSGATTIPATGGDITITAIQHASVQVEHAGKVIQIDPAQGDFSKAKPADLVLITDIHGDHLNPELVAKVRKPGVPVVMPAAVQTEAGAKIPAPIELIANGQTKTVAGVSIEAVPMYNLQRGPAAGQLFHTKGRGNGYIVTLGTKRLYFAGDTECTTEMKGLKNIDAAFIPMNLPYTMTPAEAADCVKAFKPKVAIPYHFQGQKVEDFQAALKGSGVEVRILNWYPAAAK